MSYITLIRSLIKFPSIKTSTRFSSISQVVKRSNSSESAALAYGDRVLILSLVLPSRQETCRFHLNLQSATVGQLIEEIQVEDSGVRTVQVFDEKGNSLSKSYTINSLLQYPFTIQLNQQRTFLFDPIKVQTNKSNSIQPTKADNSYIEDTVAALYHALNVMKVYQTKSLELKQEANQLTRELEPLEKVKDQLANTSQRYTSRCIWYGLAAMSFQVGTLATLTWDVYSWDIVEPISYFIAYATAIAVYAFHLMTRADFEYMTMTDRLFLRKFHQEARRLGFDVSLYNRLKNRLFSVETDLARLRAPLLLSLPVPPNPLKCKISGEEISPLNVYRAQEIKKNN